MDVRGRNLAGEIWRSQWTPKRSTMGTSVPGCMGCDAGPRCRRRRPCPRLSSSPSRTWPGYERDIPPGTRSSVPRREPGLTQGRPSTPQPPDLRPSHRSAAERVRALSKTADGYRKWTSFFYDAVRRHHTDLEQWRSTVLVAVSAHRYIRLGGLVPGGNRRFSRRPDDFIRSAEPLRAPDGYVGLRRVITSARSALIWAGSEQVFLKLPVDLALALGDGGEGVLHVGSKGDSADAERVDALDRCSQHTPEVVDLLIRLLLCSKLLLEPLRRRLRPIRRGADIDGLRQPRVCPSSLESRVRAQVAVSGRATLLRRAWLPCVLHRPKGNRPTGCGLDDQRFATSFVRSGPGKGSATAVKGKQCL